MRHRNKINSLGRKAAHRKKTMSSLATALIMNKRINTTVAKAKALRVYVEPLITKSKEDSTHSRRVVFSYLRDKYAVSELFREISQKVADRPGGYTRILKTGFRKGDGAEMCFIELVDYNTHMLQTEEDTQQKRTRRGRRRGGKKTGEETASETAQTPKASTPKDKEKPVKEAEAKEQEMPVEEIQETPAAEVQEQPEAEVKQEPAEEEKPTEDEAPEKEEPVAEKKEQPVAEKPETPVEKEEDEAEAKKGEKPEDKPEDK